MAKIIIINQDSISNYLDLTNQIFEELLLPLTDEYNDFVGWYQSKVVQGISCAERTILAKFYDNRIIGVSILKHDEYEDKICTLRVNERYRRLKIGTELLKESLIYLKTDKPLITVPEKRIQKFYPFLSKFGFKLEKRYEEYYKQNSDEFSFNGLLTQEPIVKPSSEIIIA